MRPSFRCATACEPPWPIAAAWPSSGEPPPRPCPWSTVDRRHPRSMDGGPGPPYFLIEKKSHRKILTDFAVGPLPFSEIKPQSTKIPRRHLNFKNNSRYSPTHFQKLQKGPHNFYSSYLRNRNSDFGDSCFKILRITSYFIICIH
jgi:hypothetical protein